MDFKFYIKMDEQEFGPYTLDEIKELPLLDDTLITEARLNGVWYPAKEFDFVGLSDTINSNKPSILPLWNWGAFSLSWIWGVFNGIYWPLIIIAFNFVPYVGPFVWFIISLYLGVNGNKLAWNIVKKSYSDFHKFTMVQAKWNLVGIIVFIVVLLFLVWKLYISL